MKITNNSGISLPLAVWLLHDDYDYINDPDYISVTRLMRPLRQIVLPGRIPFEERTSDVEDYIARALGNSIHNSIEYAWKNNLATKLRMLGYKDNLIEKIVINPDDDLIRSDDSLIPVYIEQRAHREIDTHFGVKRVGGKFDMVADGIPQDTKSTSAWAWAKGTRDDEHILQMSMYRWIDATQPLQKIHEDFCQVNYVFTDWQKSQARSNPAYPQKRVETKTLKLLSLKETEQFIEHKIHEVYTHWKTEEPKLPECTDEELWRSAPQFKYFADPEKAKIPGARSTKNFDTLHEANQFKTEKGKGIVVTIPGEVKRCGYCDGFDLCTQKDRYL